MLEVNTVTVRGKPTAVGSAGPFTLVVDRPSDAGGGGVGFNGGQLLYLAVAGCISNDLFREALAEGIALAEVRVTVRGDFSGEPAVSEEISYEVEIDGDAAPEQLRKLVQRVDEIAEIPNSLRRATPVRLASVTAQSQKQPFLRESCGLRNVIHGRNVSAQTSVIHQLSAMRVTAR